MARFGAIVTRDDPLAELAGIGLEPMVEGRHWALGRLCDERPAAESGPYMAGSRRAAGEVTLFNRGELVAELAATGPPPPADAPDGAVLLHYYAVNGLDGLARVRGMFAIAIVEGDDLLVIRDAIGARTLFYAQVDGCWLTASSLRCFRRWPRLPARIDLAAVRAFLTFAYLPGPLTLLAGVSEMAPGSWARLRLGAHQAELGSYWEPEERIDEPIEPAAHYAKELRQRLEAATAARLPAGEQVGILLSGGIDSSLVTALASRLHDRPVHTYSINFGTELPNELAYSGLVAAHTRSHHRILTFSGQEIAAHLAEAVALLDCPVGDPLTVPNLLLARAAAADGHRVILNGEGGDPVFGGPKNLPMLIAELQRVDPHPLARARDYLASYRKCYDELERLLSPAAQAELRTAPPLEHLVEPFLDTPRMRHLLNRLLYTNLRTKGAHHILTKVERLTASAGLEGRAPLFDEAVVAYAFTIPPVYKLAGTTEKFILKEAVRDLLPATIIDRPKSGMRVPVQHWLHGPLRELADDLLLGPDAQHRGLFNQDVIRAWTQRQGLLWPRHGGSLWLVLTLELWLRAFIDEQPAPAIVTPARRPRWAGPAWQAAGVASRTFRTWTTRR